MRFWNVFGLALRCLKLSTCLKIYIRKCLEHAQAQAQVIVIASDGELYNK